MFGYSSLSIKQKQVVWAWSFLALPVVFYSVIRFYPTFGAIILSFQEWNLLGDKTWAGLANYQKLFADPVFWKVFNNTFIYLALGTPLSLLVSFIIAYNLDKVRFMHGTIRALYFLPFMTSTVAMAWFVALVLPTRAHRSFQQYVGGDEHPAISIF